MHGIQGMSRCYWSLAKLTSPQPKAPPAPKAAPAPPATPAQAVSTPAQPPAPQQPASTVASNPPATPSPAQTTTTAPPTAAAGSGFNDPSAMLVGNRNEATIQQMEAMGFGRQESERALRAAFFNPDRAIEYLLNGIPENIQAEQRQAQQQQAAGAAQGQQAPTSPTPAPAGATAIPAAAQGGDEPINLFEAAAQHGQGGRGGGAAARGAGAGAGGLAGAAPGAAGQVNMDFLRNSPHFQQLRHLVQQQPQMLEPILQQVAEGNPQLAQMIGQNQEQFLQLLSEVRKLSVLPYP